MEMAINGYLAANEQSLQRSRYVKKSIDKTKTPEIPNWVNIIFKRFTVIYSDKWPSQSAAEILERMKEWASIRGLEKFTDEMAELAVEMCKIKYIWPPTPAEFLLVAKDAREEIKNQIRNRLPDVNTCIYPRDSDQLLEADLSAMRKIKKENPNLNWFEVGKIFKEKKRSA